MSNDNERVEDMGIVDKVVEKVGEVFGFNDIKNEIQILKDTSDDIQKTIKKLARNIELKAVSDKQKTLDDDIKNVKENLKKDVISDFKENLEPILKNYAEQYLEKRNERYLEEYKNIENYLISAKEETIELLKKDKEEFKTTLQEKKDEIEKYKEEIINLKTQLNSKESGVNDLQEQKDKVSQELKDAEETIESLRSQLNSKENKLNISKDEREKLTQELKEAQETIESLRADLSSKQNDLDNSEGNIGKLTQELKETQEMIESLRADLSSKQNDLDESKGKKAKLKEELDNVMSKIFILENTIKEKEEKIEALENENKKYKESTLSERKEVENRLQDFIEKIEAPYEGLLKTIAKNSKSKEIEEYLKFKNDRELSKSMIIFSLINEDALARKIASFYAEKKEIMMDEDFEIIKEVNKIYENDKPWGILYAEPEGQYLSSLVRDRKSSDIYKTFVAMYSPAYRKDEDGNSPLKGIVDGKK
jgi:Chromosome segregation ATPases